MRKLIISLAAVVYSVCAVAQSNFVYEPVLLTIDKQNGQYASGEQVNVYAELSKDVADQLVCVVEADGRLVQRPTKLK